MSVTRIYADGHREDFDLPVDDAPMPAEACTELGCNNDAREQSWRAADAVIAVIAVGCVAGYVAGVFA